MQTMILPDYATKFDLVSLSACFVDLKGVGGLPRQATGFFWRRGHKVFLMTNWHVVTGKNIMDGSLTSHGWCPEKLAVQYFAKTVPVSSNQMGLGPDAMNTSVPIFEIPLYEHFHKPYWLQHAMTFEWNVDLVAFEISDDTVRNSAVCVNDRSYEKLYHFAGSEIFVLGYPVPKSTSKYPIQFPVWKRGSIASEIIVPWNMRPAFLIDSRTSKGMSGSPVFSRAFGPTALGDGTIKGDNILATEFMGIYSGRLFDDENNASLGLVWHRHLIDQLLDAPSLGSRDWEPSNALELFKPLMSAG